KLDVPAYPGDLLYMGVTVQTQAGNGLKDLPVQISSRKGNPYVLMAERTDQDGFLEFHLVANQVGEDVVTVTAAGVQRDFLVSVTPPPRSQWLGGLDLKGVTSWDLLMSANVTVTRDRVSAIYPPLLQALKGKTVRLVGFMLPLAVNEKQDHFLLSANPPACFFHPPGGPSSAIEVFADRPVEMDDEAMVVEGRFELIKNSADGVLYRLRDAHRISKS
ncbi:MAG TPA: DUF3299 domain-containing protein, partial [Nevskiaceae bacterium]|nr:DUF3299 domain-containing protein [Nevskiaceae bacterium]